MAGPKGKDVNKVSVKVVPDTSKFPKELKKDLERIEAQTRPIEIEVNVKLNTAGLKAQMAALEKQLSDPITKRVRIETTGDTSAVAVSSISPRVVEQTTRQVMQLRRQYRGLGPFVRPIAASMNAMLESVRLTGSAVREVGDVLATTADIAVTTARRTADIADNLDRTARRLASNPDRHRRWFRAIGAGAAQASGAVYSLLTTVSGVASGILTKLSKVVSGIGGFVSQLGGVMKGGVTAVAGLISVLATLTVISALLTPIILTLAGAITFLIGGISAGFAGLPVPILALLGPILAITLGMKGINKEVEKVADKFTTLKRRMDTVMQKAFRPIFQELVKTIPSLTTGFEKVGKVVGDVGLKLSKVFTTKSGAAQLEKSISNSGVALKAMEPGLKKFLEMFLTIGSQTPLFKIFGDTLSGILTRFSSFFEVIAGDGRLEAGLTNVRDLLLQLSDMFVSLMSNSLDFFNGGAAGFGEFLGALTRFFDRFDWQMLGASFGIVWRSIADALDRVTDEQIMNITNSIIDFAAEVSNFIEDGGFDKLIDGVKAFIDEGGHAIGVLSDFINKLEGFMNSMEEWSNRSLWDWLWIGLKAAINVIIRILNDELVGSINWLIEGFNGLIPDALGSSLNIPKIPNIPFLADGGVITSATLAVVGEGGENEAVMPLSKLDSMLREIKNSEPTGSNGPTQEINIREIRAHDYHDFRRQISQVALVNSIPGGGSRK